MSFLGGAPWRANKNKGGSGFFFRRMRVYQEARQRKTGPGRARQGPAYNGTIDVHQSDGQEGTREQTAAPVW